jgi:hypothetical protein
MHKLPRVLQRLTEAAILGVVLLAVFVLVGSLFTPSGLDIPVRFTPDSTVYSITSSAWGAGTILDSVGTVRFDNPDGALEILYAIAVVVYLAVVGIVLVLLRRLLRSIANGNTFTRESAISLTWIGATVALFGVVEPAVQTLTTSIAANNMIVQGIELSQRFSLNLTAIFSGLIILVLGEAFRHGAALQADADLTV